MGIRFDAVKSQAAVAHQPQVAAPAHAPLGEEFRRFEYSEGDYREMSGGVLEAGILLPLV